MPLVGLASADVLGKDPEWIQKRYDGKVKFSDPLFAGAMQKSDRPDRPRATSTRAR